MLPLCVDLDGTLIKTDMLFETILQLIKVRPWFILLLPVWLLKGKAHLKHQIASHIQINVGNLPFHEDFLAYLKEQHDVGRKLVLITASDKSIAKQVADHIGIFSQVYASDGKINLSGRQKLLLLQSRFGNKGFDYAGDTVKDLCIWQGACRAIAVTRSDRFTARIENLVPICNRFGKDTHYQPVCLVLKAIRMHQWTKNFLVFVPLLAAHKLGDLHLALQAMLAFISFSLCASSIYVLNDLLDLESDRCHVRKKHRPFASGALPLWIGLVLMPVLLLAGLVLSIFLLPFKFLLALALYIASSAAYCFYLKQVMLIDVLMLAGLYTFRVIAGTFAIGVPNSTWLLAFSIFLFLSLAMVKRVSELQLISDSGQNKPKGRDYFAGDLSQLNSFGIASGYIAVLVLALYINSPDVKNLYTRPEVLWLICPLLLYWINRIWLLTHRREMHDDPIVFAMKDKASYWLTTLVAAIMLGAL